MNNIHLFRRLRINGCAILNFKDLQSHFDLFEIEKNLEEFCRFASVHCIPLVAYSNTGYKAEYMEKAVWLKLIHYSQDAEYMKHLSSVIEADKIGEAYNRKETVGDSEVPMIFADRIVMIIGRILIKPIPHELFDDISPEYRVYKRIDQDINNFNLVEKIKQIITLIRKRNENLEPIRIAVLLAVCMLAETMPEDNNRETEKQVHPMLIDDARANIPLTLGQEYRFLYHESDNLEPNETIKTYRITADAGRENEVVTVILCSTNGEELQTFTLSQGEFRYLNVAGGKVIKLLPVSAKCGNRCMQRRDLTEDCIIIESEGPELRVENNKISSFDIDENGSLMISVFVQDGYYRGVVNPDRYTPAMGNFNGLNQRIRIQYPVEVELCEGFYYILDIGGNVHTNDDNRYGRNGIVTLNDINRGQLKKEELK